MATKRVIIEHILSGKKWESDWIETGHTLATRFEYEECKGYTGMTFPSGGKDIYIPHVILNECVRTYEYNED